jgi:hypothetical protein
MLCWLPMKLYTHCVWCYWQCTVIQSVHQLPKATLPRTLRPAGCSRMWWRGKAWCPWWTPCLPLLTQWQNMQCISCKWAPSHTFRANFLPLFLTLNPDILSVQLMRIVLDSGANIFQQYCRFKYYRYFSKQPWRNILNYNLFYLEPDDYVILLFKNFKLVKQFVQLHYSLAVLLS